MIKTPKNIIGTYLWSISDIGEVKCLCRAQRIFKENIHTSQPCHCLARDTEVPAAVTLHLQLMTQNDNHEAQISTDSSLYNKYCVKICCTRYEEVITNYF